MENNVNSESRQDISFNEHFNCDKMRMMLMDNDKQSFGERFKNWLNAYTKGAREKIWRDIESYNAF